MPDTNFDTLFERFNKNIYGTSKGFIRHHIVSHQLNTLLETLPQKQLRCADIGGGMGQITELLVNNRHFVDYFDLSQKMCNHVAQSFEQNTNINIHHGPFQHTLNAHYEFMMCQAVLEWLESPFEGLSKICTHIEEDGYLFLLFYNKTSIILRNLIRGNLDAAFRNKGAKSVGLTPPNPLEINDVFNALSEQGMSIQNWFGVRCFSDFQARDVQRRLGEKALLEFELPLSTLDPYRSIARYVGVIAKRTHSYD